ncbi:MAG: hypothetical protein QME47_06800 [Candidatus Thermoplasmatota archaeon]|nr:hypothetical protein [Candidatus Thermoplasmatota archaeon]
MPPGEHLCPYCRQRIIFISEYQRWFCPTCQRYLGLLPGKSKRAIIAGIAILIVLACVLPSMVLYLWVSAFMPAGGGYAEDYGVQQTPVAMLFVSSINNNYTITVSSVTPPVASEYVQFSLLDLQGVTLYSGMLPSLEIGIAFNSITLNWIDYPPDDMLSVGDIFQVTAPYSIAGYRFRLIHIPTGGVIGQVTLF